MGERWHPKIHPHPFQRLSLALVDGHRETETDRKLDATESEGQLALGRLQRHTRDGVLRPFEVASDDTGGDVPIIQPSDDEAGADLQLQFRRRLGCNGECGVPRGGGAVSESSDMML
ncbi:hypothetical protein N7535_007838 [Penicillium sp. DV-2018c]|nr:hypothetical protein N7535_007838 [Penicillium sp. DV-2018c]